MLILGELYIRPYPIESTSSRLIADVRNVGFHNTVSQIYCRSGNFRVFKFSQISDFGTFHEVYTSRNFSSAITIIIFARFLNSRICPPCEIREISNLANITRSTVCEMDKIMMIDKEMT